MLFSRPATDDFFRARIDHMIDLRCSLAVLASRMPWQEIEARVAQTFRARAALAWPCPTWIFSVNRCSAHLARATPDGLACHCAS
ncbi:hypothetical protein [Thiomonas sp.]|uniref:hypothetical protein n=1 Tax=Thiomonas sp. TaxID=2047785 RepID=UPI0025904E04|nr:hypothetical protein [Thiomonas sp.]